MNILPEIAAAQTEISVLRRKIHSHPELCYQEEQTAALVAERLAHWGLEVTRGLGKTGVVGSLRAGRSKRSIGLRADMDALPVTEQNRFAHHSKHTGRMHACGHDGHTAMLLAAAKYLAAHREFDGSVHFIFQPAEEGGAGARAMMKDGLFTRFPCDAVFALHNWPGFPAGHFAVNSSAIMASSNQFRVRVRGKGGHAAMPHNTADPVFALLQIAQGVQSIITRNKKPVDSAVISITQLEAGHASNIVPDEAALGGTVRTFSTAVLDMIETRLRQIVEGTAAAYGCAGTLEFERNYPPTINTPDETAFALEVMREVVGAEAVVPDVEPTMGAEDFSFMLEAKPGCYALIGNGDGLHRGDGSGNGPCLLHSASYDFNDELIGVGGTYWVRLVERYLAKS